MARAYLDHASTTPPRPEALAALTRWASLPTADPGRLHEEGRTVRDALEEARRQVADLVGVAGRQVVFTSGATESVNAAVWGATRAAPGRPVLCAPVEHSAVRDASARLAPTEDIPVDGSGRLQVEALRERLRSTSLPRPALVHCQWGNHEVGTLQPVAEVVALCREAGVTVHVDAAAACGQVPIDLAALDADLVSISAHKLGGVPGAGALIVRRGSRFEPLLVGGEQERGRRAGLEALPALLAFGAAAAALAAGALASNADKARRQIASVVEGALKVEGVAVVGPDAAERLPQLVCLGVAGGGGGAGAHRVGPGRGRRPLGLGLLVREHCAVTRARGHGRRPQPFAPGQRGLAHDRRGLRCILPRIPTRRRRPASATALKSWWSSRR